jgi:hypothetical protein
MARISATCRTGGGRSATADVVYLDLDPAVALPRAAQREGGTWLDWFITKVSRYPTPTPVRDFETVCAYLRHERDVTLGLLADLPWRTIVVAD